MTKTILERLQELLDSSPPNTEISIRVKDREVVYLARVGDIKVGKDYIEVTDKEAPDNQYHTHLLTRSFIEAIALALIKEKV